MAVGAKRLIPRRMGARVPLPGALCVSLCPTVALCQDLAPNNNPVTSQVEEPASEHCS